MMNRSHNIKIQVPEEKIKAFCQRWKIKELSLFGSVLQEDFRDGSDVDILVSFSEDARWSYLDWAEMHEELKEIFGREIDLVDRKCLINPFRRHSILTGKETIYAA